MADVSANNIQEQIYNLLIPTYSTITIKIVALVSEQTFIQGDTFRGVLLIKGTIAVCF